MSFDRFHKIQASRSAGYDDALAEIRGGRKTGHWIWYIFPQLDGLGRSSTNRAYALRDLAETRAYLRDPLLRTRYQEIANAIGDQLSGGVPVEVLMGWSIDALKLTSSLTLFRAAARSLTNEGQSFEILAQLCDSILQQVTKTRLPALRHYSCAGFCLA